MTNDDTRPKNDLIQNKLACCTVARSCHLAVIKRTAILKMAEKIKTHSHYYDANN